MKILKRDKLPSGKVVVRLLGIKILSYWKHDTLQENMRRYHHMKITDLAWQITDQGGFGGLYAKLSALGIPKKYYGMFIRMKAGDICIDCGANKGKFINAALHQGAIVHAFEPNVYLADNLSKYFAGRAEIHNAAVGTKDGTAGFVFDSEDIGDESGNIGAGNWVVGHRQNEKLQVRVIDLASFLSEMPEIYMIKIDIEGAEFDLIPHLIKHGIHRRAKHIVVETHARFFPDGEARLADLKKLIAESDAANIDLNWV
jgi:FkbM family methyltransferase